MATTIIERFNERVRNHPDKVALRYKSGGEWRDITWRGYGDAVKQVNDSFFGLQTGVFTNDLANAWQAFNELEVGGVIVNDIPTYRMDNMPYGGVKDSGLGREGLRWAIEDMTEIRIMVLAHPDKPAPPPTT